MDANIIEEYIKGVVSGSILTGRFQRLTVERHLKDLETGKERGLLFDVKAGLDAVAMVRHFRHVKGKWANQRFRLSPWQAFTVYCLFGWKKFNGWQFVENWKRYRIGDRISKKEGGHPP